MRRKSVSHSSRYIVLLDEDVAQFSALLAEAFPEARYYMEPTHRQRNYLYREGRDNPLRTRPPRLLMHASLHRIWRAAGHWNRAKICMVLDPQWKPIWRHRPYHDKDYPPYWTFWSPPFPFVEFRQPIDLGPCKQLNGAVTALGSDADMITYSQPGNKDHQRFDRHLARLLRQVASGHDLVKVEYPSGKILHIYTGKASWARVGHAARRWAAENENCFLDFSDNPIGVYSGILPLPQDYEARLKEWQLAHPPAQPPARDETPAADPAEKAATPRKQRISYNPWIITLIEEDIAQLSALLAEEFPAARYYMQPTDRQCNNPYRDSRDGPLRSRPPRLLIHSSLYRIWKVSRRWKQSSIWMVADPQWKPVWEHQMHFAKDSPPYWSPPEPSIPCAEFRFMGHSYTALNGALTVLYEHSAISTWFPDASEAYPRIGRRFFRILDKVSSDLNLVEVEYASGKIVRSYIDQNAWRHFGHAARRWAAEDSSRFLTFNGYRGFRPAPADQAKT